VEDVGDMIGFVLLEDEPSDKFGAIVEWAEIS
jgi:hypothetical protein